MMLGIALKRCLKCSVGHFWLSRHEEGRWRVRTRSGWAFRIGCTLRFRSCTRAKQWYISSFYWFHVPCIVYFGNEVRPIPVPVLRLRKYSKAYLCRSITVRCLLKRSAKQCVSFKEGQFNAIEQILNNQIFFRLSVSIGFLDMWMEWLHLILPYTIGVAWFLNWLLGKSLFDFTIKKYFSINESKTGKYWTMIWKLAYTLQCHTMQ